MTLDEQLAKLGLIHLAESPEALEAELIRRIRELRVTLPQGEALRQLRLQEQAATGTWTMSAAEILKGDLGAALLALTFPRLMAEGIRKEEQGEIPPPP